MIILGVDPGSLRTGYGAIETDGRRHRLLEMGVFAPSARLELPVRLRAIHAGL
ncbi:MAG TPA: crossover junction endodeoxyribonuclease RuvC, partial [Vicinamibacteria bacterium]|nr:crossover junction endodeoxyribonuclease RuvC [Vicinamibacteria bacterium]